MAADALVFYDSFFEAVADGTMDLDTDTFHVALFTATYTPAAGDTTFSALTNEVANGNGYTTGGEALAGVSWSQTSGTATFDANDTAWSASGGDLVFRHAVLYDQSVGGANDLIGYILVDNAPANTTIVDGTTLTLQWNASGIFTFASA
jgi:hypothetical protein